MFYRYACPACGENLKNHPPLPQKKPWYQFFTTKQMKCQHCGGLLEKRFTHFDGAMAFGLMVLAALSGFIGIWRLSKFIIPLLGILFALRMLAGGIFSVYVQVKK